MSTVAASARRPMANQWIAVLRRLSCPLIRPPAVGVKLTPIPAEKIPASQENTRIWGARRRIALHWTRARDLRSTTERPASTPVGLHAETAPDYLFHDLRRA